MINQARPAPISVSGERVLPNFSGKVGEELGCRALARVVRELIDYLARRHSGA
jgi:hypothetical protein